MKFIKIISVSLAFSALISMSKADAFDFKNFPYYKTNFAEWAQVAGCVLRLDFYKNVALDKSLDNTLYPAKVLETIIKKELGDTGDAFVYLYDMGYNNQFLNDYGKGIISGDQWKNAIFDLAEKEIEQGIAWLQAAICVNILTRHKIL